ncbi:hypothetical protein DFJ74DRAFT_741339, partial [Hyaloraphidium curvatum]
MPFKFAFAVEQDLEDEADGIADSAEGNGVQPAARTSDGSNLAGRREDAEPGPSKPAPAAELLVDTLEPARVLWERVRISPVAGEDAFAPFTLLKRDLSDVKFSVALADDLAAYSSIARSVVEGTDLIAGEYEGGLKTWECAHDLLRCLAAMQSSLRGQRVLELGCGSALPGIYCLTKVASTVHLQDYNELVLQLVTAPNVVLNLGPEPSDEDVELDLAQAGAGGTVRLLSGDWAGLAPLLSPPYDLVLTSETIYRRQAHGSLLDCIEASLATDGVALVAAKRVYFGLTGTFLDFLAEVERRGRMDARKVLDVAAGVGREVWELRW